MIGFAVGDLDLGPTKWVIWLVGLPIGEIRLLRQEDPSLL